MGFFSKVHMGKYLSGIFYIENGLKQGDIYHHWFQLCFRICHQEGPRTPARSEIEWDTCTSGLSQCYLILLGNNINARKKNAWGLIDTSKEIV
jgi:hypothetical protein